MQNLPSANGWSYMSSFHRKLDNSLFIHELYTP
jgi:hypothetical protein